MLFSSFTISVFCVKNMNAFFFRKLVIVSKISFEKLKSTSIKTTSSSCKILNDSISSIRFRFLSWDTNLLFELIDFSG